MRELKQKIKRNQLLTKEDIRRFARKRKSRRNKMFDKKGPVGDFVAPYNGLSLNDTTAFDNNEPYCHKYKQIIRHNPLSAKLLGVGKYSYLAQYGLTDENIFDEE